MKIYSKEITLNTEKNIKDTKILCFADLHYSKQLGKELLEKLYFKISEYHPDYICFLGDLLNDDSFVEVYNFIDYLRYIAPVILIEGNHDIKFFAIDDTVYDNHNYFLTDEFKTILNNIPNVHYLKDNTTAFYNNLSFTGTNFYHHSHEEDNYEFLNMNIPAINENDYNILLCHSPYIINKKSLKKISSVYQNFDDAFTGHIHNALMPAYIDNKFSPNVGLYTKDTGFFPRGYLGEKEININKKKNLQELTSHLLEHLTQKIFCLTI